MCFNFCIMNIASTFIKDNVNELENVLIDAIQRLDIEMFKEFYIHTENYKKSKRLFLIRDMDIVFEEFKKLGDTYLEATLGVCGRCNKGCEGYYLIGNKSRNYMNLLFDNELEKVVDIIECTDMKTSDKNEKLNKRVYLHEFNDPDSPNNVPF